MRKALTIEEAGAVFELGQLRVYYYTVLYCTVLFCTVFPSLKVESGWAGQCSIVMSM